MPVWTLCDLCLRNTGMVNKSVYVLCISLVCAACGPSEVRLLKESEYLRTQTAKPLVYPDDVDRPEQEKTYLIPDLPKSQAKTAAQSPESLILPPLLAGVDLSEEAEDGKSGEPEEEAGSSLDDGFIETAK